VKGKIVVGRGCYIVGNQRVWLVGSLAINTCALPELENRVNFVLPRESTVVPR
jgi:hypothetical protein